MQNSINIDNKDFEQLFSGQNQANGPAGNEYKVITTRKIDDLTEKLKTIDEDLNEQTTDDELFEVEQLLEEHILNNKKTSVKLQEFIDNLREIRDLLKYSDVAEIRQVIRTDLEAERDDIINEFKKSFGTLPNNDALKKDVLILLGDLGMTVC